MRAPLTRSTSTSARMRRAGGLAALVQALTFVVGLAVYATAVAGSGYAESGTRAADSVAFLVDHQGLLQAWYAVVYLVFGVALVVLVVALHDRLAGRAPLLSRVAAGFGLAWSVLMFAVGMTTVVGVDQVATLHAIDPAAAAALWSTMHLFVEGMGGGIELVGGLWIGLVSIAVLRTRSLPRSVGVEGVVAGLAGVATVALVAGDVLVAVFGVGAIAWYAWVGVALLRAGDDHLPHVAPDQVPDPAVAPA